MLRWGKRKGVLGESDFLLGKIEKGKICGEKSVSCPFGLHLVKKPSRKASKSESIETHNLKDIVDDDLTNVYRTIFASVWE